jgi:hypothetical protein
MRWLGASELLAIAGAHAHGGVAADIEGVTHLLGTWEEIVATISKAQESYN